MEQDVVQVCQPCFEMVKNFGVLEWIGVGLLGAVTVVGFFTKKNFFSFTQGGWNLIKTVFEMFQKKDSNKLK